MNDSLFSLRGKRAVVVGGAGEIGLSISEALLEFGAKVTIIDIKNATNPKYATWKEKGLDYHLVNSDVTNRNEVKKSMDKARVLLQGPIDILVNSAGIQRRNSSELFSIKDWDEIIAVNLNAVFIYSQEAIKDMLESGAGKIINIASIMSQFGGITIPAYSASKGGVAQLTKAMSNDLASRGICINAIAPGYIRTSLNNELIESESRASEILQRTPIGRWGLPDDLKGISVFLASKASDYLTGAIIPIDGGYSAR